MLSIGVGRAVRRGNGRNEHVGRRPVGRGLGAGVEEQEHVADASPIRIDDDEVGLIGLVIEVIIADEIVVDLLMRRR